MRKTLFKGSAVIAFLFLLMAFDYPSKTTGKLIMPSSQESTYRVEPCSINNSAFQPGEEMTYKLYYNWNFVWVAAGQVTFKVKEVGNEYLLSAEGKTFKSYEWFYKVRDQYDTYVDKETLLPTTSIRNVQEGGYRLYDKISFDRQRGKAVSLRGKTKDVAKVTEYDVDNCMHDIMSIVYFTRNVDFNQMNAGANIPIKIFVDKETWPLKVKFLGKEKNKKIKGMGHFRTVQFSPQVIDNGFYFKKGSEMKVWATDDKNKIPLMIESPLSVGSVKAVLTKYKGLKHTLTAKVSDDNSKDEDPNDPDR